MFDEIKIDWRSYSIHDENNIKGFFGDYMWLSNFEKCEILYDGVIYPSSENAYQAAKIIPEDRGDFVKLSAYQTKKTWRHYIPLYPDTVIWDSIKYSVMYGILWDKFTRHDYLKENLLSTDDKYLEETNHWQDIFYGYDYKLGGKNNLGKILMEIREKIKSNKS